MPGRASCTSNSCTVDSDRGRSTCTATTCRARTTAPTSPPARVLAARRRTHAGAHRPGRARRPVAHGRRRCRPRAGAAARQPVPARQATSRAGSVRAGRRGPRPGAGHRRGGKRRRPLLFGSFSADGVGGSAKLRGEFRQGDLVATVLPSKVRLENQVLDVQPLALRRVRRHAPRCAATPISTTRRTRSFRFAVNARGLTLGWRAGTAQTSGGTAEASPASAPMPTSASPARSRPGRRSAAPRWRAMASGARCEFDGAATTSAWRCKYAQGDDAERHARRHAARGVGAGAGLGHRRDAGRLRSGLLRAGLARRRSTASWPPTGSTRSDGGLEVGVDAPRHCGGRLRNRPLKGQRPLRDARRRHGRWRRRPTKATWRCRWAAAASTPRARSPHARHRREVLAAGAQRPAARRCRHACAARCS